MDEDTCAPPVEECLNAPSCRCRNEFGINIHFRCQGSRELLAPRVEYQQWCLTVPNQEKDILLELCTNFDCCIELADGEVSEQRSAEAGKPLVISLKEMLSPSKIGLSGLIADLRDLISPAGRKIAGLPGVFSIRVRDSHQPGVIRATYHIKLVT